MNTISVIIPVYNVSDYLDKCIKSVVGQTYRALEIILVDDGSTDGSAEKCDQWKATDDRITVIHKPNGGLSDARNAGLEIASGDYIGFVDSDDWIEPDMFELLARSMEYYEADVSCCRFSYVYEDGKQETFGEDHQIHIYDRLEGLKEYLYGKTIDPFVCNKLYHSNFIRKNSDSAYYIRFIKGILGEDNPFNVEVFKHTNRVVVTGEAKYNYLQKRAGAITNSAVSQRKIDSVFRWDAIRQECHEKYPELEIYALRRQMLFYIGLYNRILGDKVHIGLEKELRFTIKRYKRKVWNSNTCEKELKIAVILIVYVPLLYWMVMNLYKKMKGEARL